MAPAPGLRSPRPSHSVSAALSALNRALTDSPALRCPFCPCLRAERATCGAKGAFRGVTSAPCPAPRGGQPSRRPRPGPPGGGDDDDEGQSRAARLRPSQGRLDGGRRRAVRAAAGGLGRAVPGRPVTGGPPALGLGEAALADSEVLPVEPEAASLALA